MRSRLKPLTKFLPHSRCLTHGKWEKMGARTIARVSSRYYFRRSTETLGQSDFRKSSVSRYLPQEKASVLHHVMVYAPGSAREPQKGDPDVQLRGAALFSLLHATLCFPNVLAQDTFPSFATSTASFSSSHKGSLTWGMCFVSFFEGFPWSQLPWMWREGRVVPACV